MTTLKEHYKEYIRNIDENYNCDNEEAIYEYFEGNGYILKDSKKDGVYYDLEFFAGWPWYDTCICFKDYKAYIGYFNDQKNIFTPVYEIKGTKNAISWVNDAYELVENFDYTSDDSINMKIDTSEYKNN